MDDDLVIGFFIGVVVVGLLVLLFCVGLDKGAASIQDKCDVYGKAKIGEVMYECKKVTT
jgi:hypothetical protein